MIKRLKCRLSSWINRKRPTVCVEAVLVNHRQKFEGSRIATCKKSYLTFELATGEQMEFEVSREESDRIQIGAKGPLEYCGRLYVSFRKPSS